MSEIPAALAPACAESVPGPESRLALAPLRVLLVVYAFPPTGGVAVLRAASLARYWPAEGIRLDVLTTRNPASVGTDASLLRDIPAEVTIHRTLTLDLPFALKKALKRLVAPSGAAAPDAPQQRQPGLLQRLAQELLLPDPQVTWLPILARAARRIVRRRNIDVVLITGAPYSDYLLAQRLRRRFPHLRIVLDFRDEWIATSFGIASFTFNTSDRARQFAIRAEAAAVRSADLVVAVSEAARQEIRSRYRQEPESKFRLIPNGFDASRLQPSPPRPGAGPGRRIAVTYLGSLYGSTQPGPLIAALHRLPPALRSRYVFRFIGHIEEPRYRNALLALGDLVEVKGYMSQREALQQMRESDYALLISHDRLNISAKFYDYLGAEKPILACIHPEGDIRRLLEEFHAGWWADSQDPAAIQRMLVEALQRAGHLAEQFHPDRARIAQYERQPLAQRYAALLQEMAQKKTSA